MKQKDGYRLWDGPKGGTTLPLYLFNEIPPRIDFVLNNREPGERHCIYLRKDDSLDYYYEADGGNDR